MMRAVFTPSAAKGTMAAPPSKSMAHRLLIAAGLSEGRSVVHGLEYSEDILASMDCLRALGAAVERDGSTVTITGSGRPIPRETLVCRESGSTLRFFLPLCLIDGKKARLQGSEKLFSRPLSVYEELCKEQGILLKTEKGAAEVEGRLHGGEIAVSGAVSSQFITGLLFTLPLLKEDSTLRLLPPVESRPYIDMTVEALQCFGIQIDRPDENTFVIPGGQHYAAAEVTVEGDYSNAAFFEALGVSLTGLRADSLQGDKIYREHFAALKKGFCSIDLSDCPDLGPVEMAFAAMHHGARFTGTRRLAIKESDRGRAMGEELHKCGITVELDENELTVCPGTPHAPADPINGHNDHRIVMAMSTLLTTTGGTVYGAQAVRKSLPDYFERLKALGIEVTTDEMDL